MTKRTFAIGVVIAVAIGAPVPAASASSPASLAAQGKIQVKPEMVSVRPSGSLTPKDSREPAVSGDGRWAAFVTTARRIVESPELPRHTYQVILRDLKLGTNRLVSASAEGVAGDEDSRFPSVSSDGRYVAFQSWASNLTGESNGSVHVYRRDMLTGEVILIDRTSAGAPSNGYKDELSISADGSVVAFTTDSTDLVPGDTDGEDDVASVEIATGEVTLVSSNSAGAAVGGNRGSVSADGSRIAFASYFDQFASGDVNETADVFVRDMTDGSVTLASPSVDGGTGNGPSFSPSLSGDGQVVAFVSSATDLIEGYPADANERQILVHDFGSGTTELMTVTPNGEPGDSYTWESPAISADGSRVVFTTQSRDLIKPPQSGYLADVFVRDRVQGKTFLMSQRNGVSGDLPSEECAISGNGSTVVFLSTAENLVDRDGNRRDDVFWVKLRR